jgi:putative Mg2+ transporter-C (MgtC) family protein
MSRLHVALEWARRQCHHTRDRCAIIGSVDLILQELSASMPDTQQTIRTVLRLIAALLAGGLIGLQRESSGKAAGLRTHILVCMGTTLFVIAASEFGMENDPMSRVVQGLVTGIGFLGAGAILKLESSARIRGLTTAAGIWMTAAIGVTIGLGLIGIAAIGTTFTWFVLAVLIRVDARIDGSGDSA